jgi:iron complex outermembrane receptor protein
MKDLCGQWFLAVAFSLVLCGAIVAPSHAQSAKAVLSGTVVDPVGGVVANASVTAKSDSNVENKATSDQSGKFSISDLAPGTYTVEVSAQGFAMASRQGVQVGPGQNQDLTISLSLGSVNDAVTVEAESSGSVAAQFAPMDGLLEARSARTEITPVFVQNFASPLADFSELVQMAPGTFSVNSNGVGLGDSKTYFRGFADGFYDIDYDGIPFYDTNTPSHHSWAFFPDPSIGSVDFDRSPGSASTIGPTPFGGSIHLLSPDMPQTELFRASISYGSFNTILEDANYNETFGASKHSSLILDYNHLSSDGFQTFNIQTRNAAYAKFQHKFSDDNVLTGYFGVVYVDSNTPNAKGPTRAEVNSPLYGYNYLLNNVTDPTNPLYALNYQFYTYHIPTTFSYLAWTKKFGRGWQIDFRPYSLSYYNHQYYNNPSFGADGLTPKAPATSSTSAVDKLNSYIKAGETFTASAFSKYGVLLTGVWYEWATTNRYQIPSNPLTLVDTHLGNFHEEFITKSAQPFVEYQYHVTPKLTLSAGFKYAFFSQALTQYQDNGKTVGCLGGVLTPNNNTGICVGGVPSVFHYANYNAYLPSVDANYHVTSHWSVYGQFATGTVVPPSGVFDVAGANVALTPKPTGANSYQGGSVLKLRNVTLNADVYYIHYQNAYVASPDPNTTSAYDYSTGGDSVSKGFEGELNVYVTHGLSFYVNGTVGTARYVSQMVPVNGVLAVNPNYNLWVANTPSDTEAFGLTYQQKYFDIGIFDKRVGSMWNDATAANGGTANQVIPIDPFNVTNLFINYTLRQGSRFDQTKFRLSFNNLFNTRGITSVTQAAKASVYTPGNTDTLGLLPGRSISMTATFGFSIRGR